MTRVCHNLLLLFDYIRRKYMVNYIFKKLFDKDKNNKCKTIIINREENERFIMIRRKEEKKQVIKTCLSEYFEKRRGLNVEGREKFSTRLSMTIIGNNSRNLSTSVVDRRFFKTF